MCVVVRIIDRLRRVQWKAFRYPRSAWRRACLPVARIGWGPHWQAYDLVNHVVSVDEEGDATLQSATDPFIEGLSYWQATARTRWFLLRDVSFWPELGLIRCGKAVIRESYGMDDLPALPRDFRSSDLMALEVRSPAIPLNRTSYYHFLIEELPTVIRAISRNPSAVALVPAGVPNYQTECLEYFGISYVEVECAVHVDLALVRDRGKYSGWPQPTDLDAIRTQLGTTLGGSSLIYVSRGGSSRSLPGEEAIESLLTRQGWLVVRTEALPWAEQAELFSGALVIAGPHGAGLANMVLAPGGIRVLELVDSNYYNPCFDVLAKELGNFHQVLDVRNASPDQISALISDAIS